MIVKNLVASKLVESPTVTLNPKSHAQPPLSKHIWCSFLRRSERAAEMSAKWGTINGRTPPNPEIVGVAYGWSKMEN